MHHNGTVAAQRQTRRGEAPRGEWSMENGGEHWTPSGTAKRRGRWQSGHPADLRGANHKDIKTLGSANVSNIMGKE